MNISILILLVTMMWWAFASCVPNSPALTAEQRAFCERQGIEASQALGKSLLAQLQGAMASGDLTTAFTVCQTAAQPITRATSEQRLGVSIRRTSIKYRNSKNAPDTLDREILKYWQSSKESAQGLVRQTGPSSARYYGPIFVSEACLNCHGPRESFPRMLTKTLNERYPKDLAHGYALGDLRGAFRVDIDLNKATLNSES